MAEKWGVPPADLFEPYVFLRAAKYLGVDPWDLLARMVQPPRDGWFWLMWAQVAETAEARAQAYDAERANE